MECKRCGGTGTAVVYDGINPLREVACPECMKEGRLEECPNCGDTWHAPNATTNIPVCKVCGNKGYGLRDNEAFLRFKINHAVQHKVWMSVPPRGGKSWLQEKMIDFSGVRNSLLDHKIDALTYALECYETAEKLRGENKAEDKINAIKQKLETRIDILKEDIRSLRARLQCIQPSSTDYISQRITELSYRLREAESLLNMVQGVIDSE